MSGPNATLSVGDETSPTFFRVVFEFESINRMQQFIDHVGEAVEQGDLPIDFKWGAEAVHTYQPDDDLDDDQTGEIVDMGED